MGCDIHLAVEHQDEAGKWWLIERAITCQWCHGVGAIVKGGAMEQCFWCEGARVRNAPFYDARSYSVFSVLANVRNGYGFAGVKTGDGFKPIAEPRGLPDDMDPRTAKWLSDEHTPSWLLLTEVIATDDYWNQATRKCGVVTDVEYRQWIESGRAKSGKGPESYSGDISGGTVIKISQDDMQRYLRDGFPEDKPPRSKHGGEQGYLYCCSVEWGETYREACQSLWRVIPDIQDIDYSHPERIRLVFDFDS